MMPAHRCRRDLLPPLSSLRLTSLLHPPPSLLILILQATTTPGLPPPTPLALLPLSHAAAFHRGVARSRRCSLFSTHGDVSPFRRGLLSPPSSISLGSLMHSSPPLLMSAPFFAPASSPPPLLLRRRRRLRLRRCRRLLRHHRPYLWMLRFWCSCSSPLSTLFWSSLEKAFSRKGLSGIFYMMFHS